jgi:hypothetical protein
MKCARRPCYPVGTELFNSDRFYARKFIASENYVNEVMLGLQDRLYVGFEAVLFSLGGREPTWGTAGKLAVR